MSLDTDWHQPSRAIEVRWWRLYRYWKMLAEIVLLHHHFHLSLGVLINVMAWRRILSFIILPWIPLLGDYFIVQDFLLLLITISWWSTQVLYCSETENTFTLIDLQQPPPTYISFLHTEETTISQIFVTLFFFVTFVTFQVYVRVGKLLKCSYFCFIWLYRPTLNLTYLCKMC